jgi:hypothetical protein
MTSCLLLIFAFALPAASAESNGRHQDRSQSLRCHNLPTGIKRQFFLAPGKQITYMLVKSRRSAQSKSLKTRAPTWLGNTCQTCVSPVSWFEFNKLDYSGDAQREPLSPNLEAEAPKLIAGTGDRCE